MDFLSRKGREKEAVEVMKSSGNLDEREREPGGGLVAGGGGRMEREKEGGWFEITPCMAK